MRKFFMASLALTTFTAAIGLFQITSCKKAEAQTPTTECPPPTFQVAGVYEGTHLTAQIPHAPAYVGMTLFPDGSLMVKIKGVPPSQDVNFSKGSWTLNGTQLICVDTAINYSSALIQKYQFTYSNKGTLSGGIWTDLTADGGVFYNGTFSTFQRVN